MTDEPKRDPRSRMRSLLGEESNGTASDRVSSPLTRLPRKAEAVSATPQETTAPPVEKRPWLKKKTPQAAPIVDPVSEASAAPVSRRRYRFGPAFWTITGIISLIVNTILIVILLGLFMNLRTLQIGGVVNIPPSLLGGLYTNFEKMDRAHIKTDIVVNTSIPVKFDLPVNQQTTVTLSQDVRIDNARVTINTGGPINITNASTSIILPAGTSLPIYLSIVAPVDQQVPVTLNVPVDIALKDTDLHDPFTGLQQVIQPLYCFVAPQAANLDGQSICVLKQ